MWTLAAFGPIAARHHAWAGSERRDLALGRRGHHSDRGDHASCPPRVPTDSKPRYRTGRQRSGGADSPADCPRHRSVRLPGCCISTWLGTSDQIGVWVPRFPEPGWQPGHACVTTRSVSLWEGTDREVWGPDTGISWAGYQRRRPFHISWLRLSADRCIFRQSAEVGDELMNHRLALRPFQRGECDGGRCG
jgi:hypothetical protein